MMDMSGCFFFMYRRCINDKLHVDNTALLPDSNGKVKSTSAQDRWWILGKNRLHQR